MEEKDKQTQQGNQLNVDGNKTGEELQRHQEIEKKNNQRIV